MHKIFLANVIKYETETKYFELKRLYKVSSRILGA